MEGFIPLYRKIKEWGWYKDSSTKALFLHILLSVNYKPGKWRGIDINPGEMITGRKVLAMDLGITQDKIRTALEHLILTGEITVKTTKKYSIVRVEKWDTYTQQIPNKSPTNPQQIPTNNKNNNTIREKGNKETGTIVATQPKNSDYEKSMIYLREISEHIFDSIIDTPEYAIGHEQQWRAFLAHFIEKDKSGKMKAEREKTFSIKLRFLKWLSNGYGSKKTSNTIY